MDDQHLYPVHQFRVLELCICSHLYAVVHIVQHTGYALTGLRLLPGCKFLHFLCNADELEFKSYNVTSP